MMVYLFVIIFDEIIFVLMQGVQFDVSQIGSAWDFFVC